jgi:hypothetical protein
LTQHRKPKSRWRRCGACDADHHSATRFIRTRSGRISFWIKRCGLSRAAAATGPPSASARSSVCTPRTVSSSWSGIYRKMSAPDRSVLVDRNHPKLSIRWQCALLSVARSGLYRARPAANDDDVLTTMRRIDELFTAWPFLGSRRMTAMLRRRDISSTASGCGDLGSVKRLPSSRGLSATRTSRRM